MKPERIKAFFAALAEELPGRARVYLTGAGAAALWGGVRPSDDLDFGLELPANAPLTWERVYEAVRRTTARTGISASVAEDIDRWGMITLLDYKAKSTCAFEVNGLQVRLLEPTRWAIGKLTRALQSDLEDVTTVFRKQKVVPSAAARVWGEALRASPPSTVQFQFRRNVEGFFTKRGRAIWGAGFDSTATITTFRKSARIVPASP